MGFPQVVEIVGERRLDRGKILGMDRLDGDVRELLVAALGTPHPRRELLELGLGDHDLRRLVRNGELQLIRKHYLEGAVEAELARIACAQAAYPRSVVSHFSAARMAELRTWTDAKRIDRPPLDAIWLTRLPQAKRNQRRDDVVVRRAGLTAEDLAYHGRLLVTSEARTVVDLARELPLREAIVTIDHALRVGTTPAALEEVLERQQRWPGVRDARRAIAFGDPRAESALESIARAAFAAAGLPEPILQAQFWDGSGWMAERVDFWWPEFRTVGEADGLAKYEGDTAIERRRRFRRSHRRDQRLSDRDLEIVHFGWEDAVGDLAELAQRFRDAFGRGQRRTGEPPIWRAPDPHDSRLWPILPPPDEYAA